MTPDNATDALAVWRLTRLATRDTITARPRDWATGRSRFLEGLLACPWCTSVWVAAGVVAARRLVPGLWEPVAEVLAASAVAGAADTITSAFEG